MFEDVLPALCGNPLLEARERLGPLTWDDPIRVELVRRYAYGVPTEESLAAIVHASPNGVVELGAGTGYWARLLNDRGVDVVAYDRCPPPSPRNRFFGVESLCWYPVSIGDERIIEFFPERTLLLVWPSWKESWSSAAVARFHEIGGTALVVAGEGPGGRTGDAVLHALLGTYGSCAACGHGVLNEPCVCEFRALWQPEVTIDLPHWAHGDATCTIFGRADNALHHRSQRHRRWWT